MIMSSSIFLYTYAIPQIKHQTALYRLQKGFHITVYILFRLKKQRFPSRATTERNIFMPPKVAVSRKPEGRMGKALSRL